MAMGGVNNDPMPPPASTIPVIVPRLFTNHLDTVDNEGNIESAHADSDEAEEKVELPERINSGHEQIAETHKRAAEGHDDPGAEAVGHSSHDDSKDALQDPGNGIGACGHGPVPAELHHHRLEEDTEGG